MFADLGRGNLKFPNTDRKRSTAETLQGIGNW